MSKLAPIVVHYWFNQSGRCTLEHVLFWYEGWEYALKFKLILVMGWEWERAARKFWEWEWDGNMKVGMGMGWEYEGGNGIGMGMYSKFFVNLYYRLTFFKYIF